jgi:hypothetical protein
VLLSCYVCVACWVLPGQLDEPLCLYCPCRGSLQPNEFSILRVAFAPCVTGAFSCETFTLVTEGGNKLFLTCKGTAVAPQLRLSTRVFTFGSVRSGSTPSKTLYLENDSDLPVQYQFLTESGGMFALSRSCGVIRPRSMAHTGVKFAGTAPGNYWQRIVCLVKVRRPACSWRCCATAICRCITWSLIYTCLQKCRRLNPPSANQCALLVSLLLTSLI